VGPGYPLSAFAPPLSIHFLIFCSLLLFPFPFLIHFTYFLLLSIPSLSTRIVPLRFQAGGRRRRPNLGLVCFVHYCVICIAELRFILVFCCIWFGLVLQCRRSLSIPFPFGWLLNKKAARVEVNISLAFLHWVGIALQSWPFVSDIAIFVLKGGVKLQLTN